MRTRTSLDSVTPSRGPGGRVRRLLDRLFRRRPPRRAPETADPPDGEPALVPRRPRPSPASGTAVLDLPQDPEDLELGGREPD